MLEVRSMQHQALARRSNRDSAYDATHRGLPPDQAKATSSPPHHARLVPRRRRDRPALMLRHNLPRRRLVMIVAVPSWTRQAPSARSAIRAGSLAVPCLVWPAEEGDAGWSVYGAVWQAQNLIEGLT
jgi:hypothetical protein